MRDEDREIYMAREREKKRDRDRPNKPGAISSVSGALFCKEHREEGRGGGVKRGEKRRRARNILESVYKEKENTHTPEGWGHSQNAREVQQSRRLRRNTSLCL